MAEEFQPPDGYVPPSRCTVCDQGVTHTPIMEEDGRYTRRWMHPIRPEMVEGEGLVYEEHEIVLDVDPWFDTRTGEWVEGNPVQTYEDDVVERDEAALIVVEEGAEAATITTPRP
jgi:hypothetical protein